MLIIGFENSQRRSIQPASVTTYQDSILFHTSKVTIKVVQPSVVSYPDMGMGSLIRSIKVRRY
jgi:hypothetical protein